VQYRDYDPIKLSLPNRRFNQKDSTFAQVLVPRAQGNVNRKVISYFDYFGYSVTSGKFLNLNPGKTQYAAGAPRGSSLSGKVLIFSFQDDRQDGSTPPEESLNFLTDPITGDSSNFFGSYFGSTVLGVDVNGDGLDDLLIGAPLYESTATTFVDSGNTSSDTSENSLSSGDEGCVFVYISLGV